MDPINGQVSPQDRIQKGIGAARRSPPPPPDHGRDRHGGSLTYQRIKNSHCEKSRLVDVRILEMEPGRTTGPSRSVPDQDQIVVCRPDCHRGGIGRGRAEGSCVETGGGEDRGLEGCVLVERMRGGDGGGVVVAGGGGGGGGGEETADV